MKSILSTVRSRYTRGISARTARLDPDERRALADEVEEALHSPPPPHSGVAAGDPTEQAHVPPESSAVPGTSESTVATASTAAEQASESAYGDNVADATDAALAELDDALSLSRAKLVELEGTERFVGVRCRRYKISLERTAAELDRLEEGAEATVSSSRGGGGADEEGPIRNEEEGVPAAELVGDESVVRLESTEGGGGPDVERGGTAAPTAAAAVPKTAEELSHMRKKQAKDEEALSKVVETHTAMLANVERMRRTIADLERKRGEISVGRDACREFLVAAEEAEEAEAMGEGVAAGRGGCPMTPGWGGSVGAAEEGRRRAAGVGSTDGPALVEGGDDLQS